jgi:two-component system cell cycle sensor histidine kinase/response regulator CckA
MPSGSEEISSEAHPVGESLSSEQRYRAIFQHSAVSLWEEDISQLRAAIRALQVKGDFRNYLDAHPTFILEATRMIKVIDVNDATLRLYGVQSKEELLGTLDITLDKDDPLMLASMREEILLIAEGGSLYKHESTAVTPAGKKLNIVVEAHIPSLTDPYPYMLVSVIDVTQQRRAEEALRESERRHADIIDFLPIATFAVDREGRVIAWNHAMAEMTGVTAAEMVGKDDYEYSLPFYGTRRPLLIDHVLHEQDGTGGRYGPLIRREKGLLIAETVAPRLRGSEATLWTKASILYDSAGDAVGAIQSFRDITEQKRAQLELHHSRQMLQSVLDNIPQRVFWKDRNLRFIGCNKAFADDAGLADSSAIVGRDDFQMSWSAVAARYRADDRRVIATGMPLLNYEEPQVRADGRELWMRTNKVPLRDREGNVIGILGTYEDITVRIELERTLEREKSLLLTLIDNLPDYIYLKDRESRFVLANRAIAEFMGVGDPAQLIGRTDRDFYPEAIAEKFAEDERRVIDEGRSIVNMEEAIRSASGRERWVFTTKVPLFDTTGRVTGFVGIGHDITDIKNTEEALRRSEEQLQLARKLEAVGRLAGGISHDFNNLLTVIKGYADLLDEGLPEKSPMKSDLRQIKRSAQRAGDLTAQLLAFSRKQVLQPRVIGLNEVVQGMEGMLARIIGEDVRLATRYAQSLGNIKADPGQIEQVMMNLVANSRDAMPLGGEITVETRNGVLQPGSDPAAVTPGEYVMLLVGDTGNGMDRDTVARIFEPFFTTKEMGKGTGLGLATVYGIVKQSGGFIFCDSEPGRGTRFTIYFPRVYGEKVADVRRPAAAESLRGSEAILLVEDEEAIRTFMATALRNAGYIVSVAGSGSEALAAVSEKLFPIQLLLTDVVMPGMNGHELGRHMQELRPGVKILYISGYTDGPIIHHGILDTRIDLLQKPFDAADLFRRVRQVLDTGPEMRRG